MELGEGKLPRTGLNALWQAVHPAHGLAWTDGSQVVLTDLQLQGREVKFGDSTIMGQFEQICGLSWAPSGTADMAALLAVQHRKHVTVWQLRPSAVGASKWQMSQTTEMRQSQAILPQGCLWHPKIVVLAVLTAQGVSVFPDVHSGSSQIAVNLNAQGRIHCACWTQDGRRLVVAVDSSLHSYIWDGTQRTLHRCPSCPVFQVDSSIRSITATVDSQVAIATELPLGKICSLNAFETFDVPPSGEDTGVRALSETGDLPSVDKWVAASETNSGIDVSPSLSDPLDLTHIRFSRSRAEESPLMCLRKRDHLTGTGQDASHLTLVTFKKADTVTRKASIPGILVPDLIAFHLERQIVAVASNTCNIILIYSVIPSALPNVQQIQLECNERPKGICFLTDKLLLILVGRRKSTETAFLPSSESDRYAIRLITREVRLGEESSGTSSGSQSPCPAFGTQLSTAERAEFTESLSFDFSCKTQGPLLTAHTSGQSRKCGRTLIQEIKSPSSTISNGSLPMGTTLRRPSRGWKTYPRPNRIPNHTSTPEPPHLPQRENFPKEKEAYQLSKDLEILSRNVMEMQQYLFKLMDFLHSEKKRAPAYPLSQDPPYIYIIYQKPCYVGPVEKRAVLLCDGKLRLSTVQRMFGLCLVEMLHDSHWILLSADSQGFIPLTFTDTQAIVVRDGSLSRPAASRDSPSHHQPPAPPPEGFGDLATQSLDKTGC